MKHNIPDNSWAICWEDTKKDRHMAFFLTPDAVADKLISICDTYNTSLSGDTQRKYGAMDFEEIIYIFTPDLDRVLIEDLPSYCSQAWFEKNSVPVLLPHEVSSNTEQVKENDG